VNSYDMAQWINIEAEVEYPEDEAGLDSLCSPGHPLHLVPMLTTLITLVCIDAPHVIHHMLYQCSPHGVPVLTASLTTWCTGARQVLHTSFNVPRHVIHRN
jgi:hypothetical protein